MATLEAGAYLNQYVAPQLLEEFRNYKDDFLALLGKAPSAAISADGIRRNKLINNVGFYVNNTDPFTAQKMNLERNITPWDKFDTDPTEVDDAEIRSLNFDKRNAVRIKHNESFRIGIRDYVMNKLAPAQHVSGEMPVLRTTGEVVGTPGQPQARRRLTYTDLLNFFEEVEALPGLMANGFNLILSHEHKHDLIKDYAATENNRDIQINDKGELVRFYTLRLHHNLSNPKYTSAGVLKAFGAVAANDDRNASIFFYAPLTVYHLNSVKILYKPETLDTTSADPKSEFRVQTYGLCDKVQEYGFGALVSGNE